QFHDRRRRRGEQGQHRGRARRWSSGSRRQSHPGGGQRGLQHDGASRDRLDHSTRSAGRQHLMGDEAPSTYGGWRRARRIGFFGLGMAGTLTLLGTFLFLIIVAQVAPALLLWVAPPAVLVGASVLVRVNGEPVGMVVVQRVRWALGSLRGHTRYKAGVITDHPHAFQLPGTLAPLQLKSAQDGFGGQFGVVWNRRPGDLTATLRVAPSSIWLANPDEVDTWVANWGHWLSRLGHMPQVKWVAVTVDTAPEPGSVLAERVGTS